MSTKPLEIPEAVKQAYALYSSTAESIAELAGLAGVSVEVLEAITNNPAMLAELEACALLAEHDGSLHMALAMKARSLVLRAVLSFLPQADITDLPDFDKIISRAIEHNDRMKLALNKGPYDNLPMISFTFGESFTTEFIDAVPVVVVENVSDAQPKKSSTSSLVLNVDVAAISLGKLQPPSAQREAE